MLNLVLNRRHNFKMKHFIALVSIVGLTILIIGLVYIIIKPPYFINRSNNIVNYIKQQKYEKFIPKDRLEKALNIISSPNSTANQKYQALSSVSFYLQDAYYKSNNPKIRNLLETLDIEAQKDFPTQHADGNFLVMCSDPECGEIPNTEAVNILNDIQNLAVDKLYVNIISTNLRNAYYIPFTTPTNKLQKFNLFSLAYQQLLEVGNPEASVSAKNLKTYVSKKYDKDIDSYRNLPKE